MTARARELFKKLFVALFLKESWGDGMKAVSPIMWFQLKSGRLEIEELWIFMPSEWKIERCRQRGGAEERRDGIFEARWNDSPVSCCSKGWPLEAQSYTALWWTQTAVFTDSILRIDPLQRCCTVKANLRPRTQHQAAGKRPDYCLICGRMIKMMDSRWTLVLFDEQLLQLDPLSEGRICEGPSGGGLRQRNKLRLQSSLLLLKDLGLCIIAEVSQTSFLMRWWTETWRVVEAAHMWPSITRAASASAVIACVYLHLQISQLIFSF